MDISRVLGAASDVEYRSSSKALDADCHPGEIPPDGVCAALASRDRTHVQCFAAHEPAFKDANRAWAGRHYRTRLRTPRCMWLRAKVRG